MTVQDARAYEDRTECVGTCIVCDPKCPVHERRAREREMRQLQLAREPLRALADARIED